MQYYTNMIKMIQVGKLGTTYTIPTGIDDEGTGTVAGGYLIAITQTCSLYWDQVRVWAEEKGGYHFQNQRRGILHNSNPVAPITNVSWHDVIVWTNALSEKAGLDPVYRTTSGEIIKDSREANADVVDTAVQTNNNGYRLPTSLEWEMAARWRHNGDDGSILVGERYWTPGDYASGATANYRNVAATRAVAWYWDEPGGNLTRPVGQLQPNHLGIYDMSGNIWEWTFDLHPKYSSERILRGGSYYSYSVSMRVGEVSSFLPSGASSNFGFRLVRWQ